jgi:LysM repeat protein
MAQQFADISSWQSADPRFDGLVGVMIKSTQGTDYISPKYEEQRKDAHAINLEVGSYHFANGEDPIAEADHYVDASGRISGEAQALDVEGDFYKNVTDPVGWCLTFLQHVEARTGNKPGIYLNESDLNEYDWARVVHNDTWLWIADWNGVSNPGTATFPVWTLYQYADTSLSGGDADIFNGDMYVWSAIAGAHNEEVPPVTPYEPAPVPVTNPSTGTFLATVDPGDTFTGIAAQYNVTLAELEAVNPGINYDLINIGQIINVPSHGEHKLNQCVVSAGDSMSSIAEQFNVTLAALEAANPSIPDYDVIQVGQVLNLP